jgi:hypothetical protein
MKRPHHMNDYPNNNEVVSVAQDSNNLLTMAIDALATVDANTSRFEPKWRAELRVATAFLQEQVDSDEPAAVARANLTTLLVDPGRVGPRMSKAEASDLWEPGEDESEAWAWANDIAGVFRYIGGSTLLVVLAALAFAVSSFGLETPSQKSLIVFAILGWAALAAANGLLGFGLYQLWVTPGWVDWTHEQFPNATIHRNGQWVATQRRWWWAYLLGGALLAASVTLGLVLRISFANGLSVCDEVLRLILIAAAAGGLVVFALGAWPIARGVVSRTESDRRLSGAHHSTTARLVTVVLPALGSIGALLLNWVFVGR